MLDLSRFARGSESERADFAQGLVDGFAEHGFVKLINHGFSEASIHKLFDMVRQCDNGSRLRDRSNVDPL